MDILRLYRDFSIPHVTEGHKHARPGWVNAECPFCTGNPGFHLGWNINGEYFMCYRCDWHPPVKTVSELLHLPIPEVLNILPEYGVNRSTEYVKPKGKLDFKFPSGVTELLPHHKKYLEKRGFNISELIKLWDIKSLGHLGGVLSGEGHVRYVYNHRVLIPFRWNGEVVTFDTRDVTDKQQDKYKACPKEREKIEHKTILYGNQEAWGSTGIIVEGPTDVWNLGEKAGAVSGIKYTAQQVITIATTFKKGAVVFDPEPQAQKKAHQLVEELRLMGKDFVNIKLNGKNDPGNLPKQEAKDLVKYIINKFK